LEYVVVEDGAQTKGSVARDSRDDARSGCSRSSFFSGMSLCKPPNATLAADSV